MPLVFNKPVTTYHKPKQETESELSSVSEDSDTDSTEEVEEETSLKLFSWTEEDEYNTGLEEEIQSEDASTEEVVSPSNLIAEQLSEITGIPAIDSSVSEDTPPEIFERRKICLDDWEPSSIKYIGIYWGSQGELDQHRHLAHSTITDDDVKEWSGPVVHQTINLRYEQLMDCYLFPDSKKII